MPNFDPKEYTKICEETFEMIRRLSTLKGGEYAGDQDRLANFRRNGANLGLEMEQVWAVYAGKHWDAVMQYVKDLGNNIKRERMEPIDGRVDDLIVYLLLFKAMLAERNRSAKNAAQQAAQYNPIRGIGMGAGIVNPIYDVGEKAF